MASNGNGPVAIEGGILMPERVVAHPSSVSPQARAFLAQMTQFMAGPRPVYPPLDDAEAWRKLRGERDAMMNAMSQGFFGESAANGFSGQKRELNRAPPQAHPRPPMQQRPQAQQRLPMLQQQRAQVQQRPPMQQKQWGNSIGERGHSFQQRGNAGRGGGQRGQRG